MLKQSYLRAMAHETISNKSFAVANEAYTMDQAPTRYRRAFLSHSHLDRELALGLKKDLAKRGVSLYIDWLDLTMPDSTNIETARKIQEAIKEADYFLYLVTANALNSKWCPWELGCADGFGKTKTIYIVPTVDDSNVERGKEYLGLYNILEWDTFRGEYMEQNKMQVRSAFRPGRIVYG